MSPAPSASKCRQAIEWATHAAPGRALLADSSGPVPVSTTVKAKPGRPKGSTNKTAAKVSSASAPATKRKLSPAGRKAIADAMKKRWAERKKAQG